MCRLCNKAPESVAHVLAGCTALAQNKYTTRHNAALKILFFEILQDFVDSVQPWYSPLKSKPVYESNNAQALWDVPLFAEKIRTKHFLWCNLFLIYVKPISCNKPSK